MYSEDEKHDFTLFINIAREAINKIGKKTSCDKDMCILEGEEVGKQISRE